MKIDYIGAARCMTKGSSPGEDATELLDMLEQPARAAGDTCPASPSDEDAECPRCAGAMRLWAAFYRCSNCGYKESCCF
jgi:hypothetical protein